MKVHLAPDLVRASQQSTGMLVGVLAAVIVVSTASAMRVAAPDHLTLTALSDRIDRTLAGCSCDEQTACRAILASRWESLALNRVRILTRLKQC